jgi:hypothetical protein
MHYPGGKETNTLVRREGEQKEGGAGGGWMEGKETNEGGKEPIYGSECVKREAEVGEKEKINTN